MSACEQGLYLHELFDEDFPVFASACNGEALLYEILDDDDIYAATEIWARKSEDYENWDLGEWLEHLIPVIGEHGHSYRRAGGGFGGDGGAHAGFSSLTRGLREYLIDIPKNTELWRARLGSGHAGQSLGAPSPENARAGRANLQGQPVLYASGDSETALHEVRPSIGEVVSVARFELKQPVKICDFRMEPETATPFVETEADFKDYRAKVRRNQAKRHLGSMFAMPVRREDEPKSYIVTQALAQMIAELPADGLAFTSSQRGRPGWNVMFFDPQIAEQLGDSRDLEVRALRYEHVTRSITRGPQRVARR